MSTLTPHDTTVSVADGDPGGIIETLSSNNDSPNGDRMQEIACVREVLIRLELDLACSSEKLVNLHILMMHVATRDSDFEAFALEKKHVSVESTEKALEFDIMSGIFDSEVKELDIFMSALQAEITNARETSSSYKHLGEALVLMEESLKQSQDQVSEMRMQSVNFQRILSTFSREEHYDDRDTHMDENGDFLSLNPMINMQTSEHQRHILRMLEKSLARELDLEKRLSESTLVVEELKHRLRSSEHEILSTKEETAAVYRSLLEADNASVVLMGISKELTGQLQVCQLHLNSSARRESELISKLQDYMQTVEVMEAKEASLQELAKKYSSEAFTLKEKVTSLEKQPEESESKLQNGVASLGENHEQRELHIKDLEEKITVAEARAEGAEAKCKFLEETTMKLNEELGLLKSSGCSPERVESLERKLREADIQLQQAIASVEASQEKQTLLYCAISDMENVIQDLKRKVSKAECRADDAEEKLIILSESNGELNEELNFLRGKLECVEASMHQAEEAKMATAKDIARQTKLITELLVQLAVERERLRKQISSLMKENKVLVEKLQQENKDPSLTVNCGDTEKEKQSVSPNCDVATDTGNGDETPEVSDTGKWEEAQRDVKEEKADSDPAHEKSNLDIVRTIDAGRLSVKHAVSAIIIAVIAVLAVCVLWPKNCPF